VVSQNYLLNTYLIMLPSKYSYVGFFTVNILRKINTKPECYNEIGDKILCFQGTIFSLDPEMTKNQVQDLVKITQGTSDVF